MTETPQHTTSSIPVATLGNGHELSVVVHQITGTSDGPTMGMTGGIHGDENDTVEYMRTFIQEASKTPFGGRILAVSCANPLAYESRTRNTPNDMMDLNRVFPGDPNGLLSLQLAHALFQVFSGQCDYFVDFHCGGIFPTVDYVYMHGDEGMARSVGSRVLYTGASYDGSLGHCLERDGVHTTVIELGGGRVVSTDATRRAVASLFRLMAYAGMTQAPHDPPPNQIVIDQMLTLRPHHGGMLVSELTLDQLGTLLPKGSIVGRVVHPQTLETLETLTAPFDPSVAVLLREGFSPISVGDYGFMFGHRAAAG